MLSKLRVTIVIISICASYNLFAFPEKPSNYLNSLIERIRLDNDLSGYLISVKTDIMERNKETRQIEKTGSYTTYKLVIDGTDISIDSNDDPISGEQVYLSATIGKFDRQTTLLASVLISLNLRARESVSYWITPFEQAENEKYIYITLLINSITKEKNDYKEFKKIALTFPERILSLNKDIKNSFKDSYHPNSNR